MDQLNRCESMRQNDLDLMGSRHFEGINFIRKKNFDSKFCQHKLLNSTNPLNVDKSRSTAFMLTFETRSIYSLTTTNCYRTANVHNKPRHSSFPGRGRCRIPTVQKLVFDDSGCVGSLALYNLCPLPLLACSGRGPSHVWLRPP